MSKKTDKLNAQIKKQTKLVAKLDKAANKASAAFGKANDRLIVLNDKLADAQG
jgi:septal ring factor EnvC (AmiA/AmiB activator)